MRKKLLLLLFSVIVFSFCSFDSVYASEKSLPIDIATGWDVDFQTNLPNVTGDMVFREGYVSPEGIGTFVISNFANIGDAKLTARKVIPMKAGYTYQLNLVYAMLFSKGNAFIDFNGERVTDTADESDQIFNKTITVAEDTDYTITIHFESAMRSNGYLKLGYYSNSKGIEGFKTNAKVIVHYVDELGNALSEDEILTGMEGSPYTTERKNIPGFEYQTVIGEETGEFTDVPKEVSYVYKKPAAQTGQVTIHYRDETGTPILPDEIITGKIATAYTTKQKEIPGYTFDSVIGQKTGQFTKEPQEVTYLYKKEASTGQIIIHYQDEAGKTLLPDKCESGELGQHYKVQPKTIAGYVLDKVIGAQSGTFTKKTKEITYKYKQLSESQGQVIIHYVDEAGNLLLPDTILTGQLNQPFETNPKEIEGYIFNKVEGWTKGNFTKQPQEVTYVYTKAANAALKDPRALMNQQNAFTNDPSGRGAYSNKLPHTGEKRNANWLIAGGVLLGILVGGILYQKNKKLRRAKNV